MKQIFIPIIMTAFILFSETLFEVKDSDNNKVLDISTDGLRVMNQGDTLMVISSTDIRANLSNSKGLSRSFSVTTTSSVKGSSNLMKLTSDSTRFWISDAGSGFGVTNLPTAGKGIGTNLLEVSTTNTKMREGDAGERYTEFSPDNIFIGLNSGHPTTPGVGNVFVGNDAGKKAAASMFSTFIGNFAGTNTVGGIRNTFVGNGSGYDNIDGYSNTFYGDNSGFNNTSGYFNNYFGHEAGYNNTNGHSNTAFGFGAGYGAADAEYFFNCIFGTHAGRLLTTGSSNIMVGYYSGYKLTTGSNNVYLGEKTGYNNETGSGNVFLGNKAGYFETTGNRLYIDNSDTTYPLIFGTFDTPRMVVIDGNASDNALNRKLFVYGQAGGTTAWYNDSDKRLKKNISTIESPLDKVMKLRGVTYEWISTEKYETGRKMGFIAQEAINVLPEVVDYNKDNDHYGMQYAPITALLVEAIKEQNNEIKRLKEDNLKMKNDLAEIKKLLGTKE